MVEVLRGTERQQRTLAGQRGATVVFAWAVTTPAAAEGPGLRASAAGSNAVGWRTPHVLVRVVSVALAVLGLAGVGGRDELLAQGRCPSVLPADCARLLNIRVDPDAFFHAGLPTLLAGGALGTLGVVLAAVPLGGRPAAATLRALQDRVVVGGVF